MDRVLINVRERPLSTDINDLQWMLGRMLSSFLQSLGSERVLPNSGDVLETVPKSFTLGLDVIPSGGGASLQINPGVLGQYNAAHPAAPGVLEDSLRLGFVRTAMTVAHPATTSTWMLLEVRVLDTNTVSESRDILDPITGNFAAASVVKQVERRLEAQVVSGTTTALPAFSGGTWVPLFAFQTNTAGLWNGLADGSTSFMVVDFRQDLRDYLYDQPGHGLLALTSINDACEVVIENHSLMVGVRTVGNFSGHSGRHKVWLRAQGSFNGVLPVPNSGYAGSTGAIEHLYLAPAISNGIEVFPVITFETSAPGNTKCGGTVKGILMGTNVQPAYGTSHASADIQHHSSYLWANFSNATAKKCVHVASYYSASPGIPLKYVQDSAGRFIFGKYTTGAMGIWDTVNVLHQTVTYSAPGSAQTFNVTFTGLVPNNARSIRVRLMITASYSEQLSILNQGGSGVVDVIDFCNFNSEWVTDHTADIPCLASATVSDKVMRCYLPITSGTFTMEVLVLGWTL